VSEGLSAIHAQVNAQMDGTSQTNDDQNIESQPILAPQVDVSRETQAKQASDMLELEKVEKFKFDGKEYTLKELRTLLAREKEAQRDYTAKMQKLAEERKSFETQRKETQRFDDNLAYDLQKVKDNPQLAQEFLKVYPQSYHRHLRAILESTSQSQPQGTPQIPVELMSQVQQLNDYVQKQEVAKAEVEIERDLTKALGQFKYASRKEVLADIYEFHNQMEADPMTGNKPTIPFEMWTKAAEASHNARVDGYKAYQKDLQQQQKQANSKARDVASGGGTPGQAPKKFDPKKGMASLHKDVLANFTSQA
jgi:hypothetical protein